MEMCKEMKLLRQKLDERGIAWKDYSDIYSDKAINTLVSMGISPKYVDYTIWRTHFTYKGKHYSVIYGYGTYGQNAGLLEAMSKAINKKGEPVGYLTAADVMKYLA